jgi:hypothetical protein
LALQIIIGLILAVLEAMVTALQIVGFGGPAGSEMEAKTPGLAELPVVVAELLIDALQPAGGLVVASLQIVVMRIDQVARAAGPLEPIVGVGLYAMLLVVPIGATVLALKTVVPVAGSRLGGMIKCRISTTGRRRRRRRSARRLSPCSPTWSA